MAALYALLLINERLFVLHVDCPLRAKRYAFLAANTTFLINFHFIISRLYFCVSCTKIVPCPLSFCKFIICDRFIMFFLYRFDFLTGVLSMSEKCSSQIIGRPESTDYLSIRKSPALTEFCRC